MDPFQEPTDTTKQTTLDSIGATLDGMFKEADGWNPHDYGMTNPTVEKEVEGVSLDEIDDQMKEYKWVGPLGRILSIRDTKIQDLSISRKLCDYLKLDLITVPCPENQHIYFIDSNDKKGNTFIITFIPIDLGEGKSLLHFEPIYSCPDFISTRY